MDKTTINTLIARAKLLSNGREKNSRPRKLMPSNEAKIVGQMRKSGCSIKAIFRVMSEKSLTKYESYPKFSAAYTNHKLYA